MGELDKAFGLAEKIGNNELRNFVVTSINEKASTLTFFVEGNSIKTYFDGKATRELKNYSQLLAEWALNPEHPKGGGEGYGFALMLSRVYKHLYQNDPMTLVAETPAPLDFVAGSGDILIARSAPEGLVPKLLIDAKLAGKPGNKTFDKILKTNVVTIEGRTYFGDPVSVVKQFAQDPEFVIESLARQRGEALMRLVPSTK